MATREIGSTEITSVPDSMEDLKIWVEEFARDHFEDLKKMNDILALFTFEDDFADGFGPVSYVDFDTEYMDGQKEGRLQWNTEDGTLEVGMPGGSVNLQIGQEMLVRVTNDEGVQINNGQAVFVSGASGSNIEVQLPIASNPLEGPLTFGLATENIAANQKGFVTFIGSVRDINTSGSLVSETWSDGDVVYLSALTAGALTNVRPTPPNTGVVIGIVVRAHATEGVIAVNPIVIQRNSLASDTLVTGIADAQILAWDGGDSRWGNKTPTVDIPISLEDYDAEPARGSETNIHGALLALATGQPLDTGPTIIPATKGIGKVLISVNAGSDISGSITITGESIDRDTGASTPADTDIVAVDALTIDGSTTDGNGNTVHSFTGAYISSKWFTGSVTISTADLTLTDVDVYHISFEQFNDQPSITIETFDVNMLTTNVNAEFDAYLYGLHTTGSKCDIENHADLHVGTNGEAALANKYWRLRRGNINESIDGTTDGIWVDIHYSNSPAYVEDVTMKVWATQSQPLTLS